MDFRHTVGGMRGKDRHPRHVDHPFVDDPIGRLGFPLNPLAVELLLQGFIDHHHIAVHLRDHRLKQAHIPLLQGLRHDGVVGIGKGLPRNLQSAGKRDALLRQQPHQLRDGDHRMGVVQLDGIFLRERCKIIPMLLFVLAQDILEGCAGEEILLFQAQALSFVRIVVWIQHAGNRLCFVALPHRTVVFLLVKQLEIESIDGFRLPEAQRIDPLSAVPNDRHIVRHRIYLLVLKLDQHLFALSPDGPRVAKPLPIVRRLPLESVLKILLKQAVFVANPVAIQRDVVCGS